MKIYQECNKFQVDRPHLTVKHAFRCFFFPPRIPQQKWVHWRGKWWLLCAHSVLINSCNKRGTICRRIIRDTLFLVTVERDWKAHSQKSALSFCFSSNLRFNQSFINRCLYQFTSPESFRGQHWDHGLQRLCRTQLYLKQIEIVYHNTYIIPIIPIRVL